MGRRRAEGEEASGRLVGAPKNKTFVNFCNSRDPGSSQFFIFISFLSLLLGTNFYLFIFIIFTIRAFFFRIMTFLFKCKYFRKGCPRKLLPAIYYRAVIFKWCAIRLSKTGDT